MATLESLESELQVSKTVIKILSRDLVEAQEQIQALKARNSEPLGIWTSEEYTGEDRGDEIEVPDFAKAEIQDAIMGGHSNVALQQSKAQLASLKEEHRILTEERDSLLGLVDESKGAFHRADKYKAKYKALKDECEAIRRKQTDTESQLHSEQLAMIEQYLRLSNQLENMAGAQKTMFDVATFMMDVNHIKAKANVGNPVTIKGCTDPYGLFIPDDVKHLLRDPEHGPLFLDGDEVWRHPSGSYFLTLEPSYRYNPHREHALDRIHRVPRRTGKLQIDLFCFDKQKSVWKYHGVFAFVGTQVISFPQAGTDLNIPESTLNFVEYQISQHEPEREWVHKMCEEGVFQIVCTGFRRIEMSKKLVAALNNSGDDHANPTYDPPPKSSKRKRGHPGWGGHRQPRKRSKKK